MAHTVLQWVTPSSKRGLGKGGTHHRGRPGHVHDVLAHVRDSREEGQDLLAPLCLAPALDAARILACTRYDEKHKAAWMRMMRTSQNAR
jgi:hypothetical protein